MPPYEVFVKAMGPYLVAQQRAEKLRNIIAPEMSHPLAQVVLRCTVLHYSV